MGFGLTLWLCRSQLMMIQRLAVQMTLERRRFRATSQRKRGTPQGLGRHQQMRTMMQRPGRSCRHQRRGSCGRLATSSGSFYR